MKTIKTTMIALLVLIFGANLANAQDVGNVLNGIGNIFGKGNEGSSGNNTVSNLLEGIFSSSNLSVTDLAGQWGATGPAIAFQSENLLKKAGGIAAAAAVESKLAPYYSKYGLNNAKFDITNAGEFTLSIKLLKLKGTITPTEEKGVFDFNFMAFGSFKIGSLKTYIQKSYNSMDIMFDAKKFMQLVSTIAKYTGNSTAKALGSLLDSYDGLCVGFKLSPEGNAGTNSGESDSNTRKNTESGVNQLLNIFNKGDK